MTEEGQKQGRHFWPKALMIGGLWLICLPLVVAATWLACRDHYARHTPVGEEALPSGITNTTEPLFEGIEEFHYKGRPINPKALEDMTGWISDPLTIIAAIDLEGATDSNRYFFEKTYETETGYYGYEEKGEVAPVWFVYKHLGVSPDGTHVLLTRGGGGGGLGVAKDLFKRDALEVDLGAYVTQNYGDLFEGRFEPRFGVGLSVSF